MKRFLALAVSVSIASLGLTDSSLAAIKPGSYCSKLGSIVDEPAKRYTCVKLGKKLIWNQGAPIAKPVPQKTPASNSSSGLENTIAKSAFESISSLRNDSTKIPLTYETGAPLDKDFLTILTQTTSKAAGVYSSFLDEVFPATIYLYSEKDVNVIKGNSILSGQSQTFTYLDWYSKDKGVKNSSIGIGGHAINSCPTPQSECKPTFNSAGAAFPSYSTKANQDLGSTTTPAHELFHVIQDRYLYENLGARQTSEAEMQQSSPALFREGAATFMQCATSFEMYSQYLECLNNKKAWLQKDLAQFKSVKTVADMTSYLKGLDIEPQNPAHYVLGALFTEWLVSKYGTTKFVQLVKQHSITKEFKTVFQDVYGVTLTQSLESAAPHIYERTR